MNPIVQAEGAPVEQGRAQGAALRALIRGEVTRRSASLPWLARIAVSRRVAATSARSLATQLPWQRERVEGMAQAARVPEARLLLGEAQTRVQGAAFHDGSRLCAVFDLAPELESLVVLRRSAPDAGGFPSAELTLAPLAGCLCGVNSEGIAVVCARDLSRDEVSLRFLAQELLFRARDLDAGIDYVRRRAAYAGGTGVLVVADARGRLCALRVESGALEVDSAPALPASARESHVALDPGLCRLELFPRGGGAESTRLDAAPR
ncbi:MAG: hypothetical protein ACHQ6T_10400 [Myxococcota bacterium]